MNRIRPALFGAALAAGFTLAACSSAGPGAAADAPPGTDGPAARAVLQPLSGGQATGMAMFHQQGDAVFVHVRMTGLTPGQAHGFHVHEKGDCSAPDGTSAGGHFNPGGHPHGPQEGPHHAGDLPALTADAKGRVLTSFEVHGMRVGSGAEDIVGRGLIVHAKPDDYTTQPTGNSGARIACAVIERVR